MSGLLHSLNGKLCGKEYRFFAHAVEAALIEEWLLGEAEAFPWRRNRSNMGEEGSRAENDC